MKWFKIAIAGVLVAAALLFFFGIPANFLVDAVKSRVEAQTGYRLRLDGETTIGFWPEPTVSLRDVVLLTGDEGVVVERLKAARIRIVLSLADLWHGRTRITELTILRPALRLPLPRERVATAPAAAPAVDNSAPAGETPTIDHIAVEDGTIAFYSRADRDEGKIERVNLDASPASADGGATVTGSLYFGTQIVKLDLKSRALPQRFEGSTIPIAVTLQVPGLFEQPVSASAELRSRNNTLAINTLSGRFGQSTFDGWASVDFRATKPTVKADLDFSRLQFLAAPERVGSSHQNALSEPWSDRAYNLDPLNFFDAQMRLTAADFSIASFHLAPVTVETTLDKGVLQAKLVNTTLYGGTIDGTVSVDASAATPAQALHVRLAGVNALPLLTDVAGFDSLEGNMQANIDVNATGTSEQAAMSNLGGAVDFHLTNGAVRGIDLTKIMHDLTNTILNGWQYNADDRTPLTNLTAHFTVANGVANVDNLELTGPVVHMTGTGTIDIGAKTLQMKVDPRLLIGQQNATGASAPAGSNAAAAPASSASPGTSSSAGQGTGLGVPVLIQGSWSEPRIFPDVAGILNDPTAVFNQLQSAGKGLFGDAGGSGNSGGAGSNNNTFDSLLGGIGNMLKGSGGNGGGFLGNGR